MEEICPVVFTASPVTWWATTGWRYWTLQTTGC